MDDHAGDAADGKRQEETGQQDLLIRAPRSAPAVSGPANAADLRIASKRAYYDNNLPFGQAETISVYVYNAGPAVARAVTVELPYTSSMNGEALTKSLRRAQVPLDVQPSQALKGNNLSWKDAGSFHSSVRDWIVECSLGDLAPYTLLEVSVRFPMTHGESYTDRPLTATVSSQTPDPDLRTASAHYVITPNHHHDGPRYWQREGAWEQLDTAGPAPLEPIDQADLRIASKRARYNNDLPLGQAETISVYVYNAGPAVARAVTVELPYTSSMDWNARTTSLRRTWVPLGVAPQEALRANGVLLWEDHRSFRSSVRDWTIECSLGDLAPYTLLEVSVRFPMTRGKSYTDRRLTATVSSRTPGSRSGAISTQYTITPNHDEDGPGYWQKEGAWDQLGEQWNPDEDPGRPSPTGWRLTTPVITGQSRESRTDTAISDVYFSQTSADAGAKPAVTSLDPVRRIFTAAQLDGGSVTRHVQHGYRITVSLDRTTAQAYIAAPDTLVSLVPSQHQFAGGERQVLVGGWFAVKHLWPGARLNGMSAQGKPVEAYVVRVEPVRLDHTDPGENQWVQLKVHSHSHSYVVGTADRGGLLAHNGGGRKAGPAALPVMLGTAQRAAQRLIATHHTTTAAPHGYLLRARRPTDPRPVRAAGSLPLPEGVPRRDEAGRWLLYLYEEASPGVVQNAREAVAAGSPWELTYDPGHPGRRTAALRGTPLQSVLLTLPAAGTGGGAGRHGQLDRDEYPPTIAREGGDLARVMYIETEDNQSAGRLVGRQIQAYMGSDDPDAPPGTSVRMRRGDRFRYAVIHEGYSSVEYLGDGHLDETAIEPPPRD
ncbi:hypothetical protein [Streptomyces sp. NBC_00648]|uniref:hypothetical protein n=1 Tax=Streptomyces sp. NBC_00648 TaxID=2975797 RepID=UPI003244B703